MEIPEVFYETNKKKPCAFSVGGLRELLEKLPPELPITCGFSEGIRLIVLDYGFDDCHLELDDVEE